MKKWVMNKMSGKCHSGEDLGIFSKFAAADIHGWDKSIKFTLEVMNEIEAKVFETRTRWEAPEINIEIVGESSILYRIRLNSQCHLIEKLNAAVKTHIEYGLDPSNLISRVGRKLLKVTVESYCAVSRSWNRICIRSSSLQSMPHPFDDIASLLLCLHQDLNTCLNAVELGSLRANIVNNAEISWLLDSNNHMRYEELSQKLRKMEKMGERQT